MLIWRDAMGIGHPEIDHARKHVIGRLNDFERALASHNAHTALGLFLTGLYEETATAFIREEKVHRECNFPFSEVHRKEHVDILARLQALKEQYDELDERANHGALLRDLAALAKDWITGHIIQSDLKLKPYWQNLNGIFLKSHRG